MKTFKSKHIGAYGVMIQDGKIVLIKKSRGGYKGKLDLPGGGVEHGETPIEAVRRELEEEVGVSCSKEELIDVASVHFTWQMDEEAEEDLHHIGIFYKVEFEQKELKIDADGQDSLGAAWYPIQELKKEKLSPFTIYVLEKLGYKID